LNDLPPSAPINWAGNTFTASQVTDILRNTKFVISDTANFNNGGVGGAQFNPNGFHTDTLDFRYFDGNLSNSGGSDYAAPTYSNGQGLIGIILHEVGHLNQQSLNFDSSNRYYHNLENRNKGTNSAFNNSDYWRNNEAFANDFSISAAAALGFDISQLSSAWYNAGTVGAIDPHQIYIENMQF
jgi:hypothetical protein